jgi:hypothetical protein
VEDVFCLTCGAVLRRVPDPEGTPGGYPAFQWFDLAGARADQCPQCGEVTSLLTTAPAPDLATVGAMARALHFLCAAVSCNYDPVVTKNEGYLEAGRAALQAAGWDPDRPRPWVDRPNRAAGGDLRDQAPAMLALLRQLLTLYDGQRLAPPETFAAYWQDVRAVIRKAEGTGE